MQVPSLRARRLPLATALRTARSGGPPGAAPHGTGDDRRRRRAGQRVRQQQLRVVPRQRSGVVAERRVPLHAAARSGSSAWPSGPSRCPSCRGTSPAAMPTSLRNDAAPGARAGGPPLPPGGRGPRVVRRRRSSACIYEHGRFTAADTAAARIGPGRLRARARRLRRHQGAGARLLRARRRAHTDAVSLLSIVVNYALNWTLVRRLGFGHVGLALSTSAVAIANCGILYVLLRRRIGPPRRRPRRRPRPHRCSRPRSCRGRPRVDAAVAGRLPARPVAHHAVRLALVVPSAVGAFWAACRVLGRGGARACGAATRLSPAARSRSAASSRGRDVAPSPSGSVRQPTARRAARGSASRRDARPRRTGGAPGASVPRGRLISSQVLVRQASPAAARAATAAEPVVETHARGASGGASRPLGVPRTFAWYTRAHLVPRMHQALRQRAVVGEQQQPGALQVEPADRIDALGDLRQQRAHRRAALRIGQRADHAARLVQEDGADRRRRCASARRRAPRPSTRRVGARPELVHHHAVDADAAGRISSSAARRDAHADGAQELLQPLGQRSAVPGVALADRPRPAPATVPWRLRRWPRRRVRSIAASSGSASSPSSPSGGSAAQIRQAEHLEEVAASCRRGTGGPARPCAADDRGSAGARAASLSTASASTPRIASISMRVQGWRYATIASVSSIGRDSRGGRPPRSRRTQAVLRSGVRSWYPPATSTSRRPARVASS